MTATTTQRLTQLDRDVEELKNGFVEVISQLHEVDGDDTSFEDRWQRIVIRLRQLRHDLRPEDFDKEQVLSLSAALLDIADLKDELDGPNRLDALNGLLINFERVRHVVRDALDEHVDGIEGSTGLVTAELLERLPYATRDEVAALLGINRRTLPRWLRSEKAPSRRLQVVARVVAILRHNWTGEGRVAWFHRPRRDLNGRTPLDLLEANPIDEDALIATARAGRSQYAS